MNRDNSILGSHQMLAMLRFHRCYGHNQLSSDDCIQTWIENLGMAPISGAGFWSVSQGPMER